MNLPGLYVGASDDSLVGALTSDVTQDFGEDVTCAVRTVEAAPAGLDGASAVHGAYIVLRQRVPPSSGTADETVVTVTLLLDGEEAASAQFTVSQTPIADRSNPPRRVSKRYEVAFSEARERSAATKSRKSPSGGVVQLQFSWSAGDINLDAVLLEHDVIEAGLTLANE